MTLGPTVFDRDVPSFDKAGLAEPFPKRGQIGRRGLEQTRVEIPNYGHRRLLCARRERPRRRSADERDERAAPHSITSLARASSERETGS
jgi:hypothetical protein